MGQPGSCCTWRDLGAATRQLPEAADARTSGGCRPGACSARRRGKHPLIAGPQRAVPGSAPGWLETRASSPGDPGRQRGTCCRYLPASAGDMPRNGATAASGYHTTRSRGSSEAARRCLLCVRTRGHCRGPAHGHRADRVISHYRSRPCAPSPAAYTPVALLRDRGMMLNEAGCSRSSCPCHSARETLTAGAVDSQA
jgi:hypothetical protein